MTPGIKCMPTAKDSLSQEHHNYWRNQLDGVGVLELPTDRPRPLIHSYQAATESFILTADLTIALREVCQREGVTLFMLLLAVFQCQMYRYTGQEEFAIGSPSINCSPTDDTPLFGSFSNTLVVRACAGGNPTFRELLARVRQTCLDAFSHQDFNVDKLSTSPLFQVMLTLLNARLRASRLAEGAEFTDTATYDLTVLLVDEQDSISGIWEYNAVLFNRQTVQRMSGHFETLLWGIATVPECRIGELPLLTEPERRTILEEWNNTAADYPRHKCIHHLFEEQALLTPAAVAVVFGERQLTYKELDSRSNQLAHHLVQRGVGPNIIVGICLERSVEMVVGLLGILKAGGAYLPLDPEYPQERLALMVEDARIPVLVTRDSLLGCVPFMSGRVVCLDSGWDVIGQQPATPVESPVTADDLAYVIFTSGSTGKPKGVLIQHNSVVRLVRNTNYVEIDAADIFLQFAPISFDAATFEIWGALLNGAKLVVFPSYRPTIRELGAFIQDNKISVLWLTASLFNVLVDADLSCLGGVSQVLAGGETLSIRHVCKFLGNIKEGHSLINGYGPTENTTFTCCHRMDSASFVDKHVPIGRPISNTTVYVLDQFLQPVPLGVPGELYIGGAGLFRGYLTSDERPSHRIIEDKFSHVAGARLYASGDRVSWNADGTIRFVGRQDDQIKLRGFRIEPSEIETALETLSSIERAVVIARVNATGEKHLVAYYTLHTGFSPPAPEELRSVVAAKLPTYMIPAAFVRLQSFPLNLNGKIDRALLPTCDENKEESIGLLAGIPHNSMEFELLQVWQDTFRRTDIGIHSNFFSLGGDSLLAALLAVRMEQLLGTPLSINSFFQAQSVAEFVSKFGVDVKKFQPDSLVILQNQGNESPLFALHGWGGNVFVHLHFAKAFAPDRPVYGLQAVSSDGVTPAHTTVDQMAEHYSRRIMSFQKSGPYHLVGYSLGGWVAYAVANHIIRQGGEIGLLALIDTQGTAGINRGLTFFKIYSRLSRQLKHFFKIFAEGPEIGRGAYFKEYLLYSSQLMLYLMAPGYFKINKDNKICSSLPSSLELDLHPEYPDYFAAMHQKYHPLRLNHKIHLFTTHDIDARELWFWKYYARKGVTIHRIFDGHYDYFNPGYIEPFVSKIREIVCSMER